MITTIHNKFRIQIRIPERVRLLCVNCYKAAPVANTRKVLFEFYAYQLLKTYFQYRLEKRSKPLQYLFILSPMRSGSSLLVHLLNSNSEIEGFGESHCNYDNCNDLEKLIYRTSVIQNTFDFKNASYVMDKMVKNYDISDDILTNQSVKFIFLLRDPATSFKSTANLGKSCYGLRSYQRYENWFQYYQERLLILQKLVKKIDDKNRCLFLNYEELLEKTPESLKKLQSFLTIKTAFSEEYTVSKHTGILRYGDPSDVLKTGKISRQKNIEKVPSKIFSEKEQALAYSLYQHCADTLMQYSQTVIVAASAHD